jgi:hypothetical protein
MNDPRRPNESEFPAPRSSAPKVELELDLELEPHPPAYKTPVPSLPRDARVPSDLLPTQERDTDPITGEHDVSFDAEKTPTESPYSLKRLSEKMDDALAASKKAAAAASGAKQAARDAADNSVEVMSRLDTFARELKALAQRVTALEISRQWAPLLLATVAIAGMIWLAFRVHDLDLQVQQLKALLEP